MHHVHTLYSSVYSPCASGRLRLSEAMAEEDDQKGLDEEKIEGKYPVLLKVSKILATGWPAVDTLHLAPCSVLRVPLH